MRILQAKTIIVFLGAALISFSNVRNLRASAGETGVPFLKLGVGARGLGMGEAYSSLAEGVEGLYWNPATIGISERPEFMFTHTPLVEDSNMSQGAFSLRKGKVGLALGFNGISHDTINAYDDQRISLGKFEASDQMFLGGLSIGGEQFQFGVSGKFFKSEIDGVSADGFAGDIGIRSRSFLGEKVHHSLVARNIGGTVSFISQEDDLPLAFVFGNSIVMGQSIILSVDLNSVKGTGFVGSGGLEWRPMANGSDLLSFRGGYTTRRNEAEGLSGASFGAGFRLSQIDLDYAWVPYGELGTSHAITFKWRIPQLSFPRFGLNKIMRRKRKRNPINDQKKFDSKPGQEESTLVPLEDSQAPVLQPEEEEAALSSQDLVGEAPRGSILIKLKNGRKIKGVIVPSNFKDSIVIRTSRGKMKIKKDKIFSIKKKKTSHRKRLRNLR